MSEQMTRESMLACRRKRETVKVDGYPDVQLKTLTLAEIKVGLQKGEVADRATNTDNNGAKFLLALSLVDPNGNRIFDDGHEAEVGELDYPWFRAINKKFNEIHYPEPSIQQLAVDAGK